MLRAVSCSWYRRSPLAMRRARRAASALVRELNKLLGSAELRQRYGQAGRQWVVERFSVDAMVEGNLGVYQLTMAKRRAA